MSERDDWRARVCEDDDWRARVCEDDDWRVRVCEDDDGGASPRAHLLRMNLNGLLVARHGETDDNLEPIRAQGFSDTPLNDRGRRQAGELAQRIADGQPIASLWASDLSRARVTAEIVGARVGLAPRLDARLREGNRGEWEGRLFVDIERDDPEGYASWRRGGPGFRFPGGESLLEQQQRVTAALTEIHRVGQLPALVVCHGGSIRVMLCARDPRGLDAFWEFKVPNVAVVPL